MASQPAGGVQTPFYRLGRFIDARDSVNKWCAAKVVHIDEVTGLTIRFDGWSRRWEDKVSFKSSRIAPFRKYSCLYTGQTQTAIREWSYSSEELRKIGESIEELIGNGIVMESPYETTQFLRGDLFNLIDCLLTATYSPPDLLPVQSFFTKVLDLIQAWMQLPDLVKSYLAGAANADLFLTDQRVAVAMAYPELMHTMDRLAGGDERTSRFFKIYDLVPKDYEPCSDTIWSSHYSKSIVFLVNYFIKKGGLRILLDWVNREKLQNLSERDLKDFDKDVCMRLLTNLQLLVAHADKNAQLDFVENTEMHMAVMLLKCQFLEKRIRGLNEFRDMIARTISQPRTYQLHPPAKRINKQSLLSFMQDQKLLTTIITDRPHGEILKRSGEIFCFYAENDILTTTHLDLLWNSRNDKHESYVRAVYEVLIAVAGYLSSSLKDALFQRFSEVPLEQYDEKYLRLLKDFSLYAVDTQSRSDATYDYALQKFFSLMLDDPKTSTPLADLSTDLLLELLKSAAFRGRQDEYLDLTLANVVDRKDSIPQSLKIVLGILRSQTLAVNRAQADQMKRLDKKFSLISSAVQTLTAYIAIARVTPPASPDAVIAGRYSHQANLVTRFNFLEFALESLDKSQFTPDSLDLLWSSFVVDPASSYDSELFYKWLSSNLDSRSTFTREIVDSVFEQHLCGDSFGVGKVTDEAFACFHRYFLFINNAKKRIEARGSTIYQRLHAEVFGFQTIVEVAIHTENENVSEKAIKILVDLHMRLGKGLAGEKDRVWTGLMGMFVERIRGMMTADQKVCRILKLFNAFLDEAEGKPSKKATKPQTNSLMTVYFRLISDAEYKKVQVPASGTVGDLRRKIAEQYKQHPYSVNLTIMNKQYTRFEDDIDLSTFKFSLAAIVELSRNPTDLIDPKAFLANHPDLLDTLFELISRPGMDSADLSWELLMRLPTNEKIKAEIAGLGEGWVRHLQSESLHKRLYCLIIVDELSDGIPFQQAFERSNGVVQLLRVFFETRLEGRHSAALMVRYAVAMFRLLGKFMTNSKDYDPARIILQTLTVLWETSQSLSVTDDLPQAIDAVTRATALLQKVISILKDKQPVVSAVANYEHMREMLEAALLTGENQQFGEKIGQLMHDLAKQLALETHILEHLLKLVERAISRTSGGSSYFLLTSKLIKDADIRLDPTLSEIRSQLTASLTSHKCERSVTEKDEVLSGILRLLRSITKKLPEQPFNPDFVQLVLHTCLFEMPSAGRLTATSPPKCKNAGTRNEALRLLNAIAKGSHETLERIVAYLDRLHQDPHWRTSRRQDWNNHHATMERSETGYVGIKNLGCTCYMSSILQQLFMLPSFREGVLSAAVTPSQPIEEDLLYQFQNVFTALKESDKQYVNPKALTKAFKPNEGQALNPMEQMDVDEFFNNFMDKIEYQIKSDLTSKSLIQDHFGGLQSTELIGKGGCSHRSERAEPFLTLPLEVKNKKSIYESLDSFVQGEILEGDNAYQCDHCDAKVTAERRVCIRHLPNILIFALRRFDFDLDTMNRLKLNDYCEFPMDIDLEPYTVEGMSRKDELKERAKKQDLESAEPGRKYPDDYYQYKLRGIVVHMGTAESGHYYSFIADSQEGSEKWFEFNDTLVREFDPKEIPAEAFGGEEKWNVTTGYGAQVVSLREKYRNGYLLFYERAGKYVRRASDEDVLTPLSFSPHPQYSTSVLGLYNQVQDDNQKFWRRRNAFSHEYFDFLLKLGLNNGHETQCWKFLLSFFLTIFVRSKEKYRAEEMFKLMKGGLTRHADISLWFIETLSVDQVLKELLLDCPEPTIRKLIVSLAKIALKKCVPPKYEFFAIRLLRSLPLAKKPLSRYFTHYFEILDFVSEGQPAIYDRLSLNLRLLSHFFDEKRQLPELPDAGVPQNRDIYLGYVEGRNIDQIYDKYLYEAAASFGYLYRTIARFPEKLRSEDLKRYITTKQSIAVLIKDANTKIASRALSRIFANFCHENLPLSQEYIKILITLLGEVDYDKQKPMLKVFAAVLKIADSMQEQRVEIGLQSFLNMMRENLAYIKATETCVEFLYKMYCKVEEVRTFVQTHRTDLKPLEDWVKRSVATGYPSQATYMTTYKQRTAQPIATSGSVYAAKPIAEKVELAKKMLKGELPSGGSGWDSDDEFPTRHLAKDGKVDIFNAAYSRWDRGTVVHNFGEVLVLRTEMDKTNIWVEADSDILAPEGSKTWPRLTDRQ